jgi:hypothetical protein
LDDVYSTTVSIRIITSTKINDTKSKGNLVLINIRILFFEVLDENSQLVLLIVDLQSKGKQNECLE